MPGWALILIGILPLSFVAGLAVGRRQARPVTVQPAPAIRQTDGSLVLERQPWANPPQKRAGLPKMPPGSTVTRITTVQVEPERPGPVAVQLVQVDTPAGPRVVASSEDGRVIGGLDLVGPVVPSPKVPRWSVQAIRAWSDRGAAWGGSLTYERGRLVGSVTVIPGPVRILTVGAGFRW